MSLKNYGDVEFTCNTIKEMAVFIAALIRQGLCVSVIKKVKGGWCVSILYNGE